MTRRMIDSAVWSNENFSEMPMGARLLQMGIISHADDQGRMKANPAYLRAQVFPYDDISSNDIQGWLEQMQSNGTIILYSVGGKQYAQLTNWWKYQSLQYAQPSAYPRPQGWQDRIRKTLTKGLIVTCNWLKVGGEPITDTCDMDGNPLSSQGNIGGGNHPAPPEPVGPIHLNGAKLPPDDSGECPGECPPEDTTYSFNENEKVSSSTAREAPEHRQTTTTADPSTGRFVREYERVWGLTLNAYHAEKVAEWAGRVTFEGWSYGLQECADTRNVGKWKYLESILRRVEVEGVAATEAKPTTAGVMNINLTAV